MKKFLAFALIVLSLLIGIGSPSFAKSTPHPITTIIRADTVSYTVVIRYSSGVVVLIPGSTSVGEAQAVARNVRNAVKTADPGVTVSIRPTLACDYTGHCP